MISNSPIGNRVYDNVNAGISTDDNSPLVQQRDLFQRRRHPARLQLHGRDKQQPDLRQHQPGDSGRGRAAAGTQIVNNTIYEPQGDGIDLEQNSEVQLRNNIIWIQSGFDISVASDSQVGFASDYNILYTSGSGQVGLWQQIARPTLATWRNADFTDADSLAPESAIRQHSGADGILGYLSPAADGRDDDFHEQSLQGSFHGGALAPVVSAATGLPIFLLPA